MEEQNRDQLVIAIKRCIESKDHDFDWREFGYYVGGKEIIDNHPRLIRSQHFGDPDYGSCILDIIEALLSQTPNILSRIIKFVNLREWLAQHNPSDEEELFEQIVTIDKATSNAGISFRRQSPAGLPFGLKKPSLAMVPESGGQKAYFEDESQIGVIRNNVYPNFTYNQLEECLSDKPIGQRDLISTLSIMNQTQCEKAFFESYVTQYNMWSEEVPVLIPQAWIQWHSKTKRDLRAKNSRYTDQLYRLDFVAFWDCKRFAILIDGIEHYGKKVRNIWEASEEDYTKRLKEDRKLRKEGWQVFRVSNWEIRERRALSEILRDLQEYMEFEEIQHEDVIDETIPF